MLNPLSGFAIVCPQWTKWHSVTGVEIVVLKKLKPNPVEKMFVPALKSLILPKAGLPKWLLLVNPM